MTNRGPQKGTPRRSKTQIISKMLAYLVESNRIKTDILFHVRVNSKLGTYLMDLLLEKGMIGQKSDEYWLTPYGAEMLAKIEGLGDLI